VTTPSGSTCTTIVQVNGTWLCILSPNPLDEEIVSVFQADPSGNVSLPVASTIDAATDRDGDGLSDIIEQQIGTDATLDDTNGDGTNDDNNDLDNISPIIEL
jgi:hypothetical protein